MGNELATLSINNTEVYAQGDYLFPQAMAEVMGLDWEGQRQRIVRSPWSEGWTCNKQVQLPGMIQSRSTFAMHHRIVPMWIAGIEAGKIKNPDVQTVVISWQREIAEVLAEHYYPTLPPQQSVQDILREHGAQLSNISFHPDGSVKWVQFQRKMLPAPQLDLRQVLNELVDADVRANAANDRDDRNDYNRAPYRPLLVDKLRKWWAETGR